MKIEGLAAVAALTLLTACGPGAQNDAAAPAESASAPANAAETAPLPATPVASGTAVASRGDPIAGKKSFGQCMACHNADKGGKDMVGPHLAGIVGAKAGTHSPSFAYSDALKASNLTWDAATLDAWIADPLKTVPGTSMHFLGIPRKATRENIIAYLESTGE